MPGECVIVQFRKHHEQLGYKDENGILEEALVLTAHSDVSLGNGPSAQFGAALSRCASRRNSLAS